MCSASETRGQQSEDRVINIIILVNNVDRLNNTSQMIKNITCSHPVPLVAFQSETCALPHSTSQHKFTSLSMYRNTTELPK